MGGGHSGTIIRENRKRQSCVPPMRYSFLRRENVGAYDLHSFR